MPHRIMIVDDDPHIREVIQFALEKSGMDSCHAKDGKDALKLFTKYNPDLIILDISMPEMDGLEFCKALRKISEVPVLFLSSRNDEIDKVVGFEIGGDDYVTKPFSPRELVSRVNAILKRAGSTAKEPKTKNVNLSHNNLKIVEDSHEAFFNGTKINLTAIEFALLKTFAIKPAKVFTRDNLMDKAYININVSDRTIDSHIRNIRSKFEKCGCPSIIETVHGVGFKLGQC